MYKLGHGMQPQTFNNMFTPSNNQDRTGNYKTVISQSNFLDTFPTSFLPKIWNENSQNVKHAMSLSSLKSQIKTYFIDHYVANEKCNFILCPDCNNNY